MMDASDSGPSKGQDLIGGLLSVGLGVFALVKASHYPMGSLLRMGPGFFPSTIAVLIILLGLALIGASVRPRPEGRRLDVRFRSVATISIGIVLFSLLIERAGLIPATLVLVLASSLAQPRWRPLRAAFLAVALTILVYVVFIVILQIPVPAMSL